MTLTLRRLRLKAVWLLVVPFLWLARPEPALLAAGVMLAALGLALRAWAAGVIHKERELSVGGPYAHTRNPLYLGSFLIGLGVTVAGGRWIFVLAFVAFFAWIYTRTIRSEARHLRDLFGEGYQEYARHVPVFLPRPLPWRRQETPASPGRGAFSLERWRRNREYEALLGVVAGFAFLVVKMLWTAS